MQGQSAHVPHKGVFLPIIPIGLYQTPFPYLLPATFPVHMIEPIPLCSSVPLEQLHFEFLAFYETLRFHSHKSLQLVSILSQMNPVHTITPYFILKPILILSCVWGSVTNDKGF
jgi:hypothetical protein